MLCRKVATPKFETLSRRRTLRPGQVRPAFALFPKKATNPHAPPQGTWSRPLADLVGPIIDPVLAKRAFGQPDVILCWDEIVGELSPPCRGSCGCTDARATVQTAPPDRRPAIARAAPRFNLLQRRCSYQL